MVTNLRNQAAFVTNLLSTQKEINTWKSGAEEQIRVVQTAGNALEDRVRIMGETAVLVRLE